MIDFLNLCKGLVIFSIVILFLLLIFGPYIDLNNRVEKLEEYHMNTCSECGQVLK